MYYIVKKVDTTCVAYCIALFLQGREIPPNLVGWQRSWKSKSMLGPLGELYDIVNKELASTWKDISEIKSYVYGKWQTSDSS